MATRLVRWDPWREIASLQQELNRALTGFGGDEERQQAWVPAVDVWETDRELVYAFDLPGIPEDKISIEVDDNSLTVSGERERDQEISRESMFRFERRFGGFSRTIGLPQGVGESDIKADFRDGVLEVRVAKPEEPKPRKIQIGTGSKGTIEGEATKQS
jgi:HSP20 family protein